MPLPMTHALSALFLASVTDAGEARMAVAAGADVIDAKNPREGALGALPAACVAAIRAAVPHHVPVSATIGDLPADGAEWVKAARAMASAGADFVKIGLFPGGDLHAAISAAGRVHLGETRLVGVLLADRGPDFDLVEHMADAGFAGVVIDTAGKSGRALPEVIDGSTLAGVVQRVRSAGLFCGLAGSLGLPHIPLLSALRPDILGFRGALCHAHDRTSGFDPVRAAAIRAKMDAANHRSAAQGAGPFELEKLTS